MPDDPWARLARARRTYAEALADRDRSTPGDPGYHEAVHHVGVAWTQVMHWERMVRETRQPKEGEEG